MIERYMRPEMARIWSDGTKFTAWLRIELLVCEALARRKQVPRADLAAIKRRARFSIPRIFELEKKTRHDVMAFVANVNESLGPLSRYFHRGLTSSDLLDTTLALQLRDAMDLILGELDRFMLALRRRALEHRHTIGVARTHGIHAEPTSFGLKFLLCLDEMGRHRARLRHARETIAVGKLSGAVGTYAHLSPAIEGEVCRALGLRPAAVATQVISRDLHAEYFSALALLAAGIEKIALEIRHLQRSEVLEVEEPFAEGQKGSSAMPHKKNPILSENLTGLARIVRSAVAPCMENISLWHERDISHSSVERVIGPDSTTLIHFMLGRATELVGGLVIHADRVRANLDRLGGLVFSQRILVALMDAGLSREEAYGLIQRHAMEAWRGGATFRDRVLYDRTIAARIPPRRLRGLFEPAYFLRNVASIYRRVLKDSH
ncbi:MAG: adenylosuccinate lyase [Nitrospirae bacterium]|nr:adenylosuccinate lyase [Nitrospirota bacterium]